MFAFKFRGHSLLARGYRDKPLRLLCFLHFAGYKIVLIKEDSVKTTKEIKKEIIKKKRKIKQTSNP